MTTNLDNLQEAVRLAAKAKRALEDRDCEIARLAARLRNDAREIAGAGSEADGESNLIAVILGGLLMAVQREVETAVARAKEDAARECTARIAAYRNAIARVTTEWEKG